MNEWDIWWANVVFDDNPNISKRRPVLILKDNITVVIAAKITSSAPRNEFLGEYAIINWKQAGLKKPSTIRLSKVTFLKQTDFHNQVGRLSAIDIINVQKLIASLYQQL